jgi:hypothetical protein
MNAPRSGGPINLTLEALEDRWTLLQFKVAKLSVPPLPTVQCVHL